MASARAREPKRGFGAEPSTGSLVGLKREWAKLKAFCPFSHRKAKRYDLNENSPPCLRQTASRSDRLLRAATIRPKFWSVGEEGEGGARFAHSWIRHWV